MARPSTMPTQPVAPCTMRIAISASIEGAKGEAMQESDEDRETAEQYRPSAEAVRQRADDDLRDGDRGEEQ